MLDIDAKNLKMAREWERCAIDRLAGMRYRHKAVWEVHRADVRLGSHQTGAMGF
jgi:hypothetical protein